MKKPAPAPPPPLPALAEGVDFYWEKGLLVFTEHYHRQRGYCCKSGCRHCPYRKAAATNSTAPKI